MNGGFLGALEHFTNHNSLSLIIHGTDLRAILLHWHLGIIFMLSSLDVLILNMTMVLINAWNIFARLKYCLRWNPSSPVPQMTNVLKNRWVFFWEQLWFCWVEWRKEESFTRQSSDWGKHEQMVIAAMQLCVTNSIQSLGHLPLFLIWKCSTFSGKPENDTQWRWLQSSDCCRFVLSLANNRSNWNQASRRHICVLEPRCFCWQVPVLWVSSGEKQNLLYSCTLSCTLSHHPHVISHSMYGCTCCIDMFHSQCGVKWLMGWSTLRRHDCMFYELWCWKYEARLAVRRKRRKSTHKTPRVRRGKTSSFQPTKIATFPHCDNL